MYFWDLSEELELVLDLVSLRFSFETLVECFIFFITLYLYWH